VNNATKHVGKYSDMEIPSNRPAYDTKWKCTCLIRDGKDTMSYGKPPGYHLLYFTAGLKSVIKELRITENL
jgi:hypothetical protein